MRIIVDVARKSGLCAKCNILSKELCFAGDKRGWICEACAQEYGDFLESVFGGEIGDKVAAALNYVISHLPPGEIGLDNELGLFLELDRLEILDGDVRFWSEYDYTVRLRAGVLTYFKHGTAYSSPPPSDN